MRGAPLRPKQALRPRSGGPAGALALALLVVLALATWSLRPRAAVEKTSGESPDPSPSAAVAGQTSPAAGGTEPSSRTTPGALPLDDDETRAAASAGFDEGGEPGWTAAPLGRQALGAMPALPRWTPSFAKRDGPPQPWVVVAPPLAALGFAWPLRGVVSSPFGEDHPLGIDIAPLTSEGLVLAARDGVVIVAGGDPCCNYGYHVILDHGQGITSVYGHMRDAPVVREGESVVRGTVLGVAGETGQSYGVHLHFEVRVYGSPVDPEAVVTAGQVVPLVRATPTAAPSPTPTPTPTPTATPGRDDAGERTPTPARAAVPVRATPTAGRTPVQPTPSALPPTATATATPRLTATATRPVATPAAAPFPSVTATPTSTPAASPTPTPTPSATIAAVPCQRARFLAELPPDARGAVPFVQLYAAPDLVHSLSAERCGSDPANERLPVTVRATTARDMRCAAGTYAPDGTLLRRAIPTERVEIAAGVASVWTLSAGAEADGPLLPPLVVLVVSCVAADEPAGADGVGAALAGYGLRGATIPIP